jgi:RNA polymerase sigma-70 factor (ECF subfamily)
VVREESARILAGLIGRLGGDFELAEEAFQEACAAALEHWPRAGRPERPGAWLSTTALRKAIDLVRGERSRRATDLAPELEELAAEGEMSATHLERLEEAMESSVHDDLLRLLFTCCHPALAEEARIALTLRTLGGLTTEEIARAFLISEPTLAQRLVRAQCKIRDAGIPYRVPRAHELGERLQAVQAVLYLIFNEGYSATRGEELVRGALCSEAIRLARLVLELLPRESESAALLALFLLQDARREARLGEAGEIVPLEDQDRSRWKRESIEEGLGLLEFGGRRGPPGPYALQAAIAAEHARARGAEQTDWRRIVALYDQLVVRLPSPVIALNRAAALAMAEGPGRGLIELEFIESEAGHGLENYLWLHTLRAELLLRLDRKQEARTAFLRALELAGTTPERRHIEQRMTEVD